MSHVVVTWHVRASGRVVPDVAYGGGCMWAVHCAAPSGLGEFSRRVPRAARIGPVVGVGWWRTRSGEEKFEIQNSKFETKKRNSNFLTLTFSMYMACGP